jgi:NADH-ubiquinone oxidoreductase chain 5
VSSNTVFWLGSISAFLTAFYSFRLIFLVFFNTTNSYKEILNKINPTLNFYIFLVLFILIIGSIFSGYFLKDIVIGLGSNFLASSIFILPWNSNIIESEFIPFLIRIIPLILSLSGFFLVCYLYNYIFFEVIKLKLKNVSYYKFFNNKWYFNNIYNFFLGFSVFNFSYSFCFKILDQGFFEPLLITNTIQKNALNSLKYYLNNLNKYIFIIFLNIILFIIILLILC